ncbi:hypothetical protein V5O48_013565 [Marasmius crinis-equi]|uniref:Uncharacterized protein n=1 Tax=Marasmius crinis-equi TaxID=585013 RepID=A0ABR3EZQ6_9AGAR
MPLDGVSPSVGELFETITTKIEEFKNTENNLRSLRESLEEELAKLKNQVLPLEETESPPNMGLSDLFDGLPLQHGRSNALEEATAKELRSVTSQEFQTRFKAKNAERVAQREQGSAFHFHASVVSDLYLFICTLGGNEINGITLAIYFVLGSLDSMVGFIIHEAQFTATSKSNFGEVFQASLKKINEARHSGSPQPPSRLTEYFSFAAPASRGLHPLSTQLQQIVHSTDPEVLVNRYSRLLHDVKSKDRVLHCLLESSSETGDSSAAIVFRQRGTLTTQVVCKLYQQTSEALSIIRHGPDFAWKDVKSNLDSGAGPVTDLPDIIREGLFSRKRSSKWRINIALSKGVTSGGRYILLDPYHLKHLAAARDCFIFIDDPGVKDDLTPSLIKKLTTKLDTVYERANLYAAKKVSSSSLEALLIPIVRDAFCLESLIMDNDYVEKRSLNEIITIETDTGSDDDEPQHHLEREVDLMEGTTKKSREKEPKDSGEDFGEGDQFSVLSNQTFFTYVLYDGPDRQHKRSPVHLTPRPDIVVCHVDGLPIMLFEICSNCNETDHPRLLVEAAGLNRLANVKGITLGNTSIVPTFAFYLSGLMDVYAHTLWSEHDLYGTNTNKTIEVHRHTRVFHLASRRREDDSKSEGTLPSEAVKLVKFLDDLREFLTPFYDEEKRGKLADAFREAKDFSKLLRLAKDSISSSRVAAARQGGSASRSTTSPAPQLTRRSRSQPFVSQATITEEDGEDSHRYALSEKAEESSDNDETDSDHEPHQAKNESGSAKSKVESGDGSVKSDRAKKSEK